MSCHSPRRIEAHAPRVACKVHGPTVAEVPWARHGVGFTRDFEDQVAWLAVHCPKSSIEERRGDGHLLTAVSPDRRETR